MKRTGKKNLNWSDEMLNLLRVMCPRCEWPKFTSGVQSWSAPATWTREWWFLAWPTRMCQNTATFWSWVGWIRASSRALSAVTSRLWRRTNKTAPSTSTRWDHSSALTVMKKKAVKMNGWCLTGVQPQATDVYSSRWGKLNLQLSYFCPPKECMYSFPPERNDQI